MEGQPFAEIFLGCMVVLVLGATSLVAFGLLIADQTKAALIVFAGGLFCAAVLADLAALSLLRHTHVSHEELSIWLTALILLLAGTGQFAAALLNPGSYATALGCAAGSVVLLAGYVVFSEAALRQDADYPGVAVLNLHSLAVAEVSLLLACASVVIALCRPRRGTAALLWTGIALLGGIAGFAIGNACITTRYTMLESPVGPVTRVRLEVYLLGKSVSEQTGLARIRGKEPSSLHFIDEFPHPPGGPGQSVRIPHAQPAWVYGTPTVGAAVGVISALGIGALLIRRSAGSPHAEPVNGLPRQ